MGGRKEKEEREGKENLRTSFQKSAPMRLSTWVKVKVNVDLYSASS